MKQEDSHHMDITVLVYMLGVILTAQAPESVWIQFEGDKVREYTTDARIFKKSEYLSGAIRQYEHFKHEKSNKTQLEMECSQKTFDIAYRLLEGESLEEGVSEDDIVEVLCLGDFLMLSYAGERKLSRGLASATARDTVKSGGLKEEIKEYMEMKIVKKYVQELLGECGLYVSIIGSDGDGADGTEVTSEVSISAYRLEEIISEGGKWRSSLGWFLNTMDVRGIHVHVSDCKCSEEMTGLLLEIKSAERLKMSFHYKKCLGSLEHLHEMENLKELDVSRNNLDRRDMMAIGEMRRLTRLCISDCDISSGSLWYLHRMEDLEELDVSRNDLDSSDMEVIGSMWNLTKLNIHYCRTRPGSLWYLKGLKNLKKLDVSGNHLDTEDIKMIRKMRNLGVLSIGSFRLNPGILVHLQGMRGLREMEVWDTCLNAEDIIGIGKMKELRKLGIRYCKSEPGSLEHLRGKKSLEELDFDSHGLSLMEIGKMKSLKRLNVNWCKIEPGGVSHLRGMEKLEELYASHNNINAEDMKVIGGMKSLRRLDIRQCKLNEGSVKDLKGIESLEELYVSYNDLNTQDMEVIGGIKSLRRLDIRQCKLNEGSVKDLKRMEKLEELDVSVNDLNTEDMKVVGGMKSLRRLRISGCNIKPGSLRHLKSLERLTEICAFNTQGISQEDLEVIDELRSRGLSVNV